MRVIGVELSGNDANICLLSLAEEAKDLRYFHKTFAQLVQDYKIDHIVIRQRPMKGKFAGGAIGFKLEAALELLNDVEVTVLSPTVIKESLKRNPVLVPMPDTGLKMFQEVAFNTAFAYLMKDKYAA
jgi:hypothetical protein